MNHVNSESVSATTGQVHATTSRVHAIIGQVPATVGRMREEIAAEHHRNRALHNICPHSYFLTNKFHRCVPHVSQQPIHHHMTTK
jgi:hypothetical protein